MSLWLQQHWQTLALTWRRLARDPMATLLNVGVIGIALSLPLAGYLVLQNLSQFSHQLARNPQMSLFLARDANRSDIAALEAQLKSAPAVRAMRFVPRDQALRELRQTEGLTDVIAALRTNPLPDAFVIDIGSDPRELAALEVLVRGLPKVDNVQMDSAWIRRLENLLDLGRTAVLLLATLLACGLVAVTFNTIRLQILTQKDEIEVGKLIGATDAFIRRPFFHLGVALGGLGGAFALGLVYVCMRILNLSILELSKLYASDFRLEFFGLGDSLTLLAFSAVLGWLGSYLSVSRHLHSIEPR